MIPGMKITAIETLVVKTGFRGPRPWHFCAIRTDEGLTGGRVVEYAIETAAGELLAIVPGMDAALLSGQSVSVSLSPRGVALID
jgi:hypothetical protein